MQKHTLAGYDSKTGFVNASEDGHLVFENDERAKFWGINLEGSSLFMNHETADEVLSLLARNGINMVRLHQLDRYGYSKTLIDYDSGNSSNLKSEMLDRIDYIIYKCRQFGIHVYLDLLDARRFMEGEGIVNGSLLGNKANVVSIFNETLMDMQKEYATNLLTHMNPYTGLSYVNDSTIAVVEVTNENGMFWEVPRGQGGWHDIPEPYFSELSAKWNEWLVNRYENRTTLDNQWQNLNGIHGLLSGENPVEGTVALPDVIEASKQTIYSRDYDDPIVGHARVNDGYIFGYELLSDYYSMMHAHLRQLGVKVPIGASDNQWQIYAPTQRAIGEHLDFSAAGYYYDHPSFGQDPLMTYKNTPELLSGTESILPVLSAQKIAGVPMIVREWNNVFPNDYRCESYVQMATYASLQDWDAVLIHALGENVQNLQTGANRMLWWSTLFDPARWSQVSTASKIFLDGFVEPLEQTIDIGYSYSDSFYAMWGDNPWQYRVAPYLGRVQNYYFEEIYTGSADITIASGRTSTGYYNETNMGVMITPWSGYTDIYNKHRERKAQATSVFTSLNVTDGTTAGTGEFVNFAYDSKNVSWSYFYGISVSDLPTGATGFGMTSDDVWCSGFYTDSYLIMPSSDVTSSTKNLVEDPEYSPNTGNDHNVFEVRKHDSLASRILMDFLYQLNFVNMNRSNLDSHAFQSTDGSWYRNETSGVFYLDLAHVKSLIGFANGTTDFGELAFVTDQHHFAATVISLDNRPISSSNHMRYTAVANAWNTNQNTTLVFNEGENYAYSLMADWGATGTAPVIHEDIFVRVNFAESREFYGINRGLLGEALFDFHTTTDSVYLGTNTQNANGTVAIELFVDPAPPSILDVSEAPNEAQAGRIVNASIQYNTTLPDIQNASLLLQTDSSGWTAVAMDETEGGNYSASLGPGAYDSTTTYRFYLEDVFGQNSTTSSYQVTWIDSITPEFHDYSWTPQKPSTSEEIEVTCTVTDSGSDLEEVYIEWSFMGEQNGSRMQSFGGDSYQYTIGPFSEAGQISIEIEASDIAGNSATKEFSIEIVESEGVIDLPISLLIAAGAGIVVVLIVGSAIKRR